MAKVIDDTYLAASDAIINATVYIFLNHLGRLRNKKECVNRYLDMLGKVIRGEEIV